MPAPPYDHIPVSIICLDDDGALVPSIYVSSPEGWDSYVPENNNYKTSIHEFTQGTRLVSSEFRDPYQSKNGSWALVPDV